MTPKEAIEHASKVKYQMVKYSPVSVGYVLSPTDAEWLELAVGALEKQIPKKVKIEKYAPTRCNCGFEFSIHYGDGYYSIPFELKTPYCRNCGQAIDWSDEE